MPFNIIAFVSSLPLGDPLSGAKVCRCRALERIVEIENRITLGARIILLHTCIIIRRAKILYVQ